MFMKGIEYNEIRDEMCNNPESQPWRVNKGKLQLKSCPLSLVAKDTGWRNTKSKAFQTLKESISNLCYVCCFWLEPSCYVFQLASACLARK